MATITWTSGASSDWDVVSNWSTAAPGSASIVAISVPGTYDVTIGATEAVSIDSLYLTEAELTVIGALTLNDAAATSIIGPSATLQGQGSHNGTWDVYDVGSLLDEGTIALSGAGAYMTNYAATLANAGMVLATSGAQILLESPDLTNLFAGTLTGGTYVAVGAASVIDLLSSLPVSTTLVADDADITLSGTGSELYGYLYSAVNHSSTAENLEYTLGTIGAAGTLNLLAGRGYSGTLALTDNGQLTLGGGTLALPGLLVNAAGTLVGFGTVAASITGSGVVEAQGGTLDLLGSISGSETLRIDAGAIAQAAGSLTGSLVNQGTLLICAGSLDVAGSISGSGGIFLSPGSVGAVSTLELNAPFSNGITFSGDYSALRLDQPQNFTGTISGVGAGDTIDLAGIVANGAGLVGTTLDLTYNGAVVDALALANLGSGLTYTATPDGAGGTALVASGQGVNFNFVYDSSVANAPAGFKEALTLVADDLGALIKDPITVNIEVGWGEIGNGQVYTLTGGVNAGGPFGGIYLPYNQFKVDFIANESDAADVIAAANLPATDPTGGAGVYLAPAQEKAWGLLPQNSSALDGEVGFTQNSLFNFGTSFTTSQSDEAYFIGVAEHEITHAMGRTPGTYLNMFRFSAPGTLQTDGSGSSSAYFSIDNGNTTLQTFDWGSNLTTVDPSDWLSTESDPFNIILNEGATTTISTADDNLLSVLGFDLACFASGTRLLSERGEIKVEDLTVGEAMPTQMGKGRSRIIWIGHQHIDCRGHPRPEHVWPVRIRAGAFAAQSPRRDLFLSPEHAVLIDGVLIPVKYLVNGTTIVQQPRDEITYWHVELERHDVILAEGLACETYLDTDNRGTFAVGAAPGGSPPGANVEAIWEARGCARLLTTAALHAPATSDLAALLQPDWYLAAHPDVAACGIDAATHYRDWGHKEGRLPCPEPDLLRGLGLIDPAILNFTMPDVVLAGIDPAAHFCSTGWQELRRPNSYFDTGWYLSAYDIPAGLNPLLHYVLTGEGAGRLPSENFHPAWYRRHYGLRATTSPLAHYLAHRRSQTFSPLPSFDVASYTAAHAATLPPGRDPFLHALGRPQAQRALFHLAA